MVRDRAGRRRERRSEGDDRRSLDDLEGRWPPADPDDTPMVTRAVKLHAVPLPDLTVDDLRLLIGQQIGLQWLLPRAVRHLIEDPLLEATYYPGDLLSSVVQSAPEAYWREEELLRAELLAAIDRLDPGVVAEAAADERVLTARGRLRLS